MGELSSLEILWSLHCSVSLAYPSISGSSIQREIEYAGAGISALLIVGLIPILTGVASFFALKETYGLRELLGTGLGLLGVALITVPGLLLNRVDWLFKNGSGKGGSLAVLGASRCVHWRRTGLEHCTEFSSSDRGSRNNHWRPSHTLVEES
jgi:drug/metabolite transporter (DMT)-like permease